MIYVAMTSRPQLLLIDGHALAFRAFHALARSELRTSRGEPTYAVFGFAKILLATITEEHPDYVAIAFDVGPTFRHERYPHYKATRAKTPPEFEPQLGRMKQLVTALNIPIYTAEGYEADDILGTIARQAADQQIDTLILTPDTDTLQLVNDHVTVMLVNPYNRSNTTTRYTVEAVRERYDLSPAQLTDLRGLKGDPSDNIPGIKGIGEQGAIALLRTFGTIEGIYAQFDEVPTRYQKLLAEKSDQAHFYKDLATIVCTAPVTFDPDSARTSAHDHSALICLFHELEFGSSLLKQLPTPTPDMTPDSAPPAEPTTDEPSDLAQQQMFGPAPMRLHVSPSTKYEAVTNEQALQSLVARLSNATAFAFDTEISSINPMTGKLVGLSIACDDGHAWYIPVGHRHGDQLDQQLVLDALRPYLTDPTLTRFAHHAKFDIEVLQRAGLEPGPIAIDTMIAAGILNKRLGLKELAFSELHLPVPPPSIEDLIGRGAKQTTFDTIPIERATPYAATDAALTFRLAHALMPQIEADTNATYLFHEIEMPLIPVIIEMETTGIALNLQTMETLRQQFTARLADLTTVIYDLAGEPFNINSVPQLSTILFERLHISTETIKKTPTGRYSLTADALEKLRPAHPIIAHILDYRHLARLISAYVDALPSLINSETGRIHTSFHQMGTATGRLSSTSPNLQNIPVRSDDGSEIRRAFVAPPGYRFLAADYSQIELRVLAHITQDPNLIRVFEEGQDIHTATAAQLFHISPTQVTSQQRRMAKSVVFGTVYGISSFGLSQRTDLTRTQAQHLIDALFHRFPGIRTYIDQTIAQGYQDGYVQSLFGRRRWLPDLRAKGPRRQAAEREAINTPIQATAADIMKRAMVCVSQAIHAQHPSTRLLLQVHDELILEVPEHACDAVANLVRQAMETVSALRVPLTVNLAVGDNWDQLEPYAS